MENKVLANVGGNAIYQSEVDEVVRMYVSRGQNYDTPQGREAILQQLIDK